MKNVRREGKGYCKCISGVANGYQTPKPHESLRAGQICESGCVADCRSPANHRLLVSDWHSLTD